jgi:hypothetical protein
MYKEEPSLFEEIKEMLLEIRNNQSEILTQLDDIKNDQRKLHEEIRLNYMTINNHSNRNEILN